MPVKIIIAILLFTPFIAMSQTLPEWTFYLNKTKLFTSSVDTITNVSLSTKDTGLVTFDFKNRDTNFKRSVIIMNEKRNTLLQKRVENNCTKVSFLLENLHDKTSLQPVTICISDIPSDPAKAALVRVAPVAICRIVWTDNVPNLRK